MATAADRDADAAIQAAGGKAFLPLDAYVGVYHDPWRGDAEDAGARSATTCACRCSAAPRTCRATCRS